MNDETDTQNEAPHLNDEQTRYSNFGQTQAALRIFREEISRTHQEIEDLKAETVDLKRQINSLFLKYGHVSEFIFFMSLAGGAVIFFKIYDYLF